MTNHYKLVLSLASLLVMSPVWAVQMTNLYEANIPVSVQTDAIKSRAELQALQQVLSKVSGNSYVLENPIIKTKLSKMDNIESIIEEMSYVPSPSTPTTPYNLQVKFNQDAINSMLTNAAVPLWSQNRPLLVAWVEYEDPGKTPVIVDNEGPTNIQLAIKRYSDLRGLPIILPMMDVTDINKVTVNDITTMALPILTEASKRYGSEGIVVIHLVKQAKGYSIQSKMMVNGEEWEWNIVGDNIDEAISNLLNNVGDTLIEKYASGNSISAEPVA